MLKYHWQVSNQRLLRFHDKMLPIRLDINLVLPNHRLLPYVEFKNDEIKRKNVRIFANILDLFVSGVKKCQKMDPCRKMSENSLV